MTGFAGVNEECWCPCAGQGGRDLARDMSGFADANDDNPPLAVKDVFASAGEVVIHAVNELGYRVRLELQYGTSVSGKCVFGHFCYRGIESRTV